MDNVIIKKLSLAVFKFILFLVIIFGLVFSIEEIDPQSFIEVLLVGIPILAAFVLGTLYRKDIFKN